MLVGHKLLRRPPPVRRFTAVRQHERSRIPRGRQKHAERLVYILKELVRDGRKAKKKLLDALAFAAGVETIWT